MSTALVRFRQHRSNAKRRGIGFFLTFDQWWTIWKKSGMYEHRGRGGFVMARFDDDGAYEVDNVEIISASENFRQAMDVHYCGDRDYS
jgi:hypothetical protein